MTIQRINPKGMYQPNHNIYTQVIKSSGNQIVHLAGTVPFDEDSNVVGNSDLKLQVKTILENIKISLDAANASPSDVVRINVYTVDVENYITNGAPLVIEFFGNTKPVSTTVEVSRLVHPEWLVEIEVTAIIR